MEQPGWAGGMSLPAEAGCDPQFQEQTGDSQQEQLEQRPPHRRHRAGRLSGSLFLVKSAKCNPKRQATPAT